MEPASARMCQEPGFVDAFWEPGSFLRHASWLAPCSTRSLQLLEYSRVLVSWESSVAKEADRCEDKLGTWIH